MRRNDVASTSFRRHVPTRFFINQCQIITFLILKSDNIENSRIELKGIVLQVRSNQIKVTFIIILPFNLVHLLLFLFHIEIEGKCGWFIGGGGGGGQRVCNIHSNISRMATAIRKVHAKLCAVLVTLLKSTSTPFLNIVAASNLALTLIFYGIQNLDKQKHRMCQRSAAVVFRKF